HNLNARIQYAIGPKDQLVISPSVGFTTGGSSQVRASLQRGVIQQDQTTNSTNQITTPSIGGNVLYNHLFDKPGRNYSLNMGARSNGVDNIDNNVNWIKYYSPGTGALEKDSLDHRLNQIDNSTLLTAVRFIYSEPLSRTSRLQFSYNMKYHRYNTSMTPRSADPSRSLTTIDSLSSACDYSFASHQLGINYADKSATDELSVG